MNHRPSTLRERLRADTAAAHSALEATLPITVDEPGLSEYRDHLRFLLGFHAPIEARLKLIKPLARVLPDIGRRWKTEALQRDLGIEAGPPSPPDHLVPSPAALPEALGVLYVLEGATLGARTILTRLRRAGVLPGEIGSDYLNAYGSNTGLMWRRMVEVLNAVSPEDQRDVVRWARRTFEALSDWRDQWNQLI